MKAGRWNSGSYDVAEVVEFSLVGFAVVVAAVVVWRVVMRDPTIRKVRFGFFYEREREDEER